MYMLIFMSKDIMHPIVAPTKNLFIDYYELAKEFQTMIGRNNAKYFDAEGWLYFTRESFDLFIPVMEIHGQPLMVQLG